MVADFSQRENTFLKKKKHGNRRCCHRNKFTTTTNDKPRKSSKILRVKPKTFGHLRRFRNLSFYMFSILSFFHVFLFLIFPFLLFHVFIFVMFSSFPCFLCGMFFHIFPFFFFLPTLKKREKSSKRAFCKNDDFLFRQFDFWASV